MANEALILLGSNLGDRKAYLCKAIDLISKSLGEVNDTSGIYVTAAWGIDNANDFYNQAVSLHTEKTAIDTLNGLLAIEEVLGRIRTGEMTSRTIDLDIAFWNDEVIEKSNLIVPHPRLHMRSFALAPLNEIVPEKVHPVLSKSVSELYESCPDQSEVTILPA